MTFFTCENSGVGQRYRKCTGLLVTTKEHFTPIVMDKNQSHFSYNDSSVETRMKPLRNFLGIMLMSIMVACNIRPTVTPPTLTPEIILVTQEVFVTREIATPTPKVVVITSTPTSTLTPAPTTPPQSLSHDWFDYGGICMRPDNIPEGVQINPDMGEVERARTMILESLWRLIVLSESVDQLTPGFASSSSLVQGTLKDVHLRGPFIPIGKLPPRSDPWSFTLEDPTILWGKSHPGEKFKGVALDSICFEFFPPLEFESQKQVEAQFHYIHLVGGLSHAKFGIEDILGSQRLNIKIYKSQLAGTRDYKDLLVFAPSNTFAQNALAANEHIGALIATLNTVLWGNFDGDGYPEFGYGPKNSDPLPLSSFHTINLFVPQQ